VVYRCFVDAILASHGIFFEAKLQYLTSYLPVHKLLYLNERDIVHFVAREVAGTNYLSFDQVERVSDRTREIDWLAD
jgi:hypothetical protein